MKKLPFALSFACALLVTLLAGASSAQAITQTFTYTGGEQSFVVPAGVTQLQVLLVGGSGGEGGVAGGVAAKVTAALEVTPGQTLYVEVGGIGKDSGEGGGGGFNGGATGGGGAGGGGGASDIRLLPLASGLSPDTRLVVAAGGGGGGGTANEAGGAGGAAGNAGEADQGGTNLGGGAGTESSGGVGGTGCGGTGTAGQRGVGGAGDDGEVGVNGGGGGGGGLYGGGGGSGGCTFGGGGGGGGSSFLPAGGTLALASALALPEVAITYTLPPPTPPPPTGPVGGPTTISPPDTVLGFHPRKKVKTAKERAKVKFTFSATTSSATFQCKVDKAAYAPCASPRRFKAKIGKHKFSVRAVKGGVVDPTPATFRFTVVKVD